MLEMPLNNVVVILVKFLILFDLDQVAFSLLFVIYYSQSPSASAAPVQVCNNNISVLVHC